MRASTPLAACDNRAVVVPIDEQCAHRLGLFRPGCGRDAVAACVYCGAPFCEEHGERHEDYADVCLRKRCRTKYGDVHEHQEFVRRHSNSNRMSVCAHQDCRERMQHRCARCLLQFCDEHVGERDTIDTNNPKRAEVRALVCDHCHDRRKLWR